MGKRPAKKPSAKGNRRNEIILATEKLLRTRGFSGVTTRQIAEEVGCSEGALYVHFKGRLDLLMAVLEESLPDVVGPLNRLRASAGRGTPRGNLEAALRGIFSFHRRVVPVAGSLFAEPELLSAWRESMGQKAEGPYRGIAAIADYIRTEQEMGRISPQVDAETAAGLLMASSFFRAFMESFLGQRARPQWSAFVRQVVAFITPGASADADKAEA